MNTTTMPLFATLVLLAGCTHKEVSPLATSSPVNNPPQILVLLSGSDHVTTKEGVSHRTGYFLSELTGPGIALERAGLEVVFATPGGKTPSMDPSSNDQKWFKTPGAMADSLDYVRRQIGLKTPLAIESLSDENLSNFIGIFVPGGHAPLEDLANNSEVGRILEFFHNHEKPTALICHGPAALLSAKQGNHWLYNGYMMTGFSAAEEKQEEDAGHLDGHMPFYLDEELRANGGVVSVASPWTSSVVKDRELITGQNPMSEEAFTSVLLEAVIKVGFGTKVLDCHLQGIDGMEDDGRFYRDQTIEVTNGIVNLESIATDGDTHWVIAATFGQNILKVQFSIDSRGEPVTGTYQCLRTESNGPELDQISSKKIQVSTK